MPRDRTAAAVDPIAIHDGMAAAYHAQRERVAGTGDMWAGCVGNFKANVGAPLDQLRTTIASYLRPGDTVLDVGGGAGRLSLPLASRCGEVICIDPSEAMGGVFRETVREAGIPNARFVPGAWPDTDAEGDVALVAHVTYFVRRIEPFIAALQRAARRRVVISTRSVAPPNQVAPFYELLRGEPLAPVPGPDELLAVLRALDIPAEVVDAGEALAPSTAPVGKTPQEATEIHVRGGVALGWVLPGEAARCRALITEHFDSLFAPTDLGYRPRVALGARELIITWETRR